MSTLFWMYSNICHTIAWVCPNFLDMKSKLDLLIPYEEAFMGSCKFLTFRPLHYHSSTFFLYLFYVVSILSTYPPKVPNLYVMTWKSRSCYYEICLYHDTFDTSDILKVDFIVTAGAGIPAAIIACNVGLGKFVNKNICVFKLFRNDLFRRNLHGSVCSSRTNSNTLVVCNFSQKLILFHVMIFLSVF